MTHVFHLRFTVAAALLTSGTPYSFRREDTDTNAVPTTRLRAKLTGPARQSVIPEGNAAFRSRSSATRLAIEVDSLEFPADTLLAVCLQSGLSTPVPIGQIRLAESGWGKLEVESVQPAELPAVQKGDVLTITHQGVVVLTGAFRPS